MTELDELRARVRRLERALGPGVDLEVGSLTLDPYERHKQVPAFLAGNPASHPTQVSVGTAAGLRFASSGTEYAYGEWEIPDDWDGGDVYIEIDWHPDSGAMTGTDTVKWDLEWRAIQEGETVVQGTAAALSVTDSSDYVQYRTKHTRFTIPYDHADQPLSAQDHIYFRATRDTGVANDFAGTVVVTAFEIVYTSVSVPTN